MRTKTLNRLKKQRRPFTIEHFYIYDCGNNIYQFRDRESHMVLSTACDLESLEKCISIILNRYKNYDLYLKAISSLSEQHVTEKQQVQREKEFEKRGHNYVYLIDSILTDFYSKQEEIEDTRRKRTISPVIPQTENAVKEEKQVNTIPEVIKLTKKRRSRLL